MRTVVVAVIGSAAVVFATRVARRAAVAERLPARRSRLFRVPSGVERRVAGALDAAAIELSVVGALQCWAAAVAASAFLGASVGGALAAAGASVLVGGSVPVVVAGMHNRRDRRIGAAVPGVVEQIASELRAGGTIATAVASLGRGDGPLAADFATVDARLALGAPMPDALAAWAQQRRAAGVDVVAGALAMCASVGGRSADALDALASSLRDRLAVVAEARALSAQARMSALVIGAMPLLYIAWSAMGDRRALTALTGTAVGRTCVVIGIALEIVGALWMRRILRSGSVL